MAFRPVTVDMLSILEAYNVGSSGLSGGASGGWPIFIGAEPDGPDNCITLYDSPGEPPNPKFLLEYPRFYARIRSRHYEQGFAKAEELKSALLGLPSQNIDDIRYDGIYVVVDTHFLQADKANRKIFVNTWRTIREPVDGEHRIPL